MILRARSSTLTDLIEAQPLLQSWYGPKSYDLPKFWAEMLSNPTAWSLTIEGYDFQGEPYPVSYSLSVFVSEAYSRELLERPYPSLAGEIVERYFEKADEPLSLKRTREEHAGDGLALISLHTASPEVPIGETVTGRIGELRSQTCFEAMRGYKIERCLREVYTEQAVSSFCKGGWRVVRGDATRASFDHPILLVSERSECQGSMMAGTRMAAMYIDYPTRLGLKGIHRELLQAALDGLTDEELAVELSLTPSAIKKRWAAIYAHVDRIAPLICPENNRQTARRGSEKRRRLLKYLRDHPEEFRPFVD